MVSELHSNDDSGNGNNVQFNKIAIGIELHSSDCIEICVEAHVNNLGERLSLFADTVEFILRLVRSGYTKVLLNCSKLRFYDAPHFHLFGYPQKLINDLHGRMIVTGLDELDRKSVELGFPDGYLCFNDDRGVSLSTLLSQ